MKIDVDGRLQLTMSERRRLGAGGRDGERIASMAWKMKRAHEESKHENRLLPHGSQLLKENL